MAATTSNAVLEGQLLPAQALAAFHRRARLSHAQDPEKPDRALCGFPMRWKAPESGESSRCVVCLDLSRTHRDFVGR